MSKSFASRNILIYAVPTLIALGTTKPRAEEILLENWESGISSGAWKVYGSPTPSVYAEASGNQAFISNGDGSWPSGAISMESHALVSGMVMEYRSVLHASGIPGGAHHDYNAVGLTFFSPGEIISDQGIAGDFGLSNGAMIAQVGGAATTTDNINAHTYYSKNETFTWTPELGVYSFDSGPDYGLWNTFRMVTTDAGTVRYYKNDAFVAESDPIFDYSLDQSVHVWMTGRSLGTVNLVDDLHWYTEDPPAVPEPASFALFGLALPGIALLARRSHRKR